MNLKWDMVDLFRNLRFAFRTVSKNYRVGIVISLTLALGIGSTTLVFDVIDSVLLHPFPYRDSARLATFYILWPNQLNLSRFPLQTYFDFKEQNHVFADLLGLAFLSVRYSRSNGTEQFLGGLYHLIPLKYLGFNRLWGAQLRQPTSRPKPRRCLQ